MLDLCLLGTGGALPLPDRGLSAGYLRVRGRGLLIDCGEGTQTAIRRLGWGFRTIDAMLITHFHGDHCGGLPGLLLSLGKAERREPFHIYGGPGLQKIVTGLRVVAPLLPYPVVLHEFSSEGMTAEVLDMQVTAFPLDHGVPCFGYALSLPRTGAFQPQKAAELGIPQKLWGLLQGGQAVEALGREVLPEEVLGPARQGLKLLWATDTRPVADIVHFGQGADLMVLEGMYGDESKRPQALKNHHMLFAEAAELARQAGAKQLLLTHFSNCIDDPAEYLPRAQRIFPNTQAGTDGMTVTLRYPD